MSHLPKFSFDSSDLSAAYDDVLVPLFFDAWAVALVDQIAPRAGWCVVDVATGTGIVAQHLATRVGQGGSVVGVDLSADMLAAARRRCARHNSVVRFVEAPADSLALDDDMADALCCQQGFQFFPDKARAAAEMYRVLKPGATVYVSTWCSVEQCTFFGTMCDALVACDEVDTARMMGVPFNHMPSGELATHFKSAGFADVAVAETERPLVFDGGPAHAYETAFATPIGPRLRAMPEPKCTTFREHMLTRLDGMTVDGVTTTRMVSNVLTACRPATGHRPHTGSAA